MPCHPCTGPPFDIARHGYAGLLTGTRATSGDDAAMVQARDRFLSTGSYAPIRDVGARLAADAVSGQATVVDVGCGTVRPFPLADGTADVVLDVFAPRNPAEFHRVLRPAGRLIVVRPTGRHLVELRGHVPAMLTIDPDREQRLHSALTPFSRAVVTEQVG